MHYLDRVVRDGDGDAARAGEGSLELREPSAIVDGDAHGYMIGSEAAGANRRKTRIVPLRRGERRTAQSALKPRISPWTFF